jgi:hypothetical protein
LKELIESNEGKGYDRFQLLLRKEKIVMEKEVFLTDLKEIQYYSTVILICDELWETECVGAWSSLCQKIKEKALDETAKNKIRFRQAHVLLLRWYQLKISIDSWIENFSRNPHPGPNLIIERDADFLTVFSLFYSLHGVIRNYAKLLGFTSNQANRLVSKLEQSPFYSLRQHVQYI